MRPQIDPLVDCVFKSLLGKDENKNLLIHFLNAVLEPKKDEMIVDVTIKNPYNEKEFIGDKLSVVDVKAIDERGKTYQIEVQLAIHPSLASRILYTWSKIYHSQIREGDNYKKLNPVISIWMLNGNLFSETNAFHLKFFLNDVDNNLILTDHLAIHILQLPKWVCREHINSEKERWMYLFKQGKYIDTDNPPDFLKTNEMRQAMNVLRQFSENEKDHFLYQSRLDAILTYNTLISHMEEIEKQIEVAKKQLEEVQKEKEAAQKEKEIAQKEKEMTQKEKEMIEKKFNELLLLLKEKGIELNLT